MLKDNTVREIASYSCSKSALLIWPMERMESDSDLSRDFIDRVAFLRKRRGMTQLEMARALGIPVERYKKYERRSALPQYLMERFAAIVGADIEYLITGRTVRRRGMGLDEL